jgi:hypothetical protein
MLKNLGYQGIKKWRPWEDKDVFGYITVIVFDFAKTGRLQNDGEIWFCDMRSSKQKCL